MVKLEDSLNVNINRSDQTNGVANHQSQKGKLVSISEIPQQKSTLASSITNLVTKTLTPFIWVRLEAAHLESYRYAIGSDHLSESAWG